MSASQGREHRHLSSILAGKRRSTLCGYLVGCLVLRFQRSNGQIPGYQARTFPPVRQRIACRVQALCGSGKAFCCSLDAPELFMPTFWTHKGDHCDSVATWRGLIDTSVWVFPAVHHPDGLLICFRSANLTFHHDFSVRCWSAG
jgi:hypothetical protein